MREAHPIDGVLPERQRGTWLMGSPDRKLLIEDPLTLEERTAVARECETSLEFGFPVVVDDLDDAVNRAYAAWPDRLYLVDRDGAIVYRGGKGPMGFKPNELEAVIQELAAFYGDDPAQR